MRTDLGTLNAAVDAEWGARSHWTQDQPMTLVNEAFRGVVDDAPPGAQLRLDALLAKMLSYRDSMASRVATRVGIDPAALADRLLLQHD